jgi:hypothetical protein
VAGLGSGSESRAIDRARVRFAATDDADGYFSRHFSRSRGYKPGTQPFVRESRGYPANRSLHVCEQLLGGLEFQQDSNALQQDCRISQLPRQKNSRLSIAHGLP